MKKILYILLLPLILFLVSCGGGEEDLQPVDPPSESLEEILVGHKWCLSNTDEDGFLLSSGGGFFTTQKCTPHDWQGSWIIEDNLIKYSITTNSIQTTMLWGEVSEYSSTQVKILLNNNSSSTVEAVYSLTAEDIYGCMDSEQPDYNPLANCDDQSCIAGRTYIPDTNFEQKLIELGLDDVLDGSVFTENINDIEELELNNFTYTNGIVDLTGIEDFTALTNLTLGEHSLTSLNLSNNVNLERLSLSFNFPLTSLDVSNNTALTELYTMGTPLTSLDVSNNINLVSLDCTSNQLTSLDLSNNTALRNLGVMSNQLTSLDVSNNTDLESLNVMYNQLTNLDLSNNTALTYLECQNNPNLTCIEVDNPAWSTANWTNIDPQHYFSEDCP